MIRRRKPLARTALKRTRRTRIAPVSAKRAALADERRAFVAEILHKRAWCEACLALSGHDRVVNIRHAVDVHERWTRAQGGPIVPSQGLTPEMVVAVCRQCHDYIHDHPAAAIQLGLLRGVLG